MLPEHQAKWLRKRWASNHNPPNAIATPYGTSGRPSFFCSFVLRSSTQGQHSAGQRHQHDKEQGVAGREPQGERPGQLDVTPTHRADVKGEREQQEDRDGNTDPDRGIGPRATPVAYQNNGAMSAIARLSPLAMVRVRMSMTAAHSSIAVRIAQQ